VEKYRLCTHNGSMSNVGHGHLKCVCSGTACEKDGLQKSKYRSDKASEIVLSSNDRVPLPAIRKP